MTQYVFYFEKDNEQISGFMLAQRDYVSIEQYHYLHDYFEVHLYSHIYNTHTVMKMWTAPYLPMYMNYRLAEVRLAVDLNARVFYLRTLPTFRFSSPYTFPPLPITYTGALNTIVNNVEAAVNDYKSQFDKIFKD